MFNFIKVKKYSVPDLFIESFSDKYNLFSDGMKSKIMNFLFYNLNNKKSNLKGASAVI